MMMGGSALLEVQWIELAYNLSGALPTEKGSAVCHMDEADDGSDWQPYAFPPPHSLGFKLGFSTSLLGFAIILVI